jgi:phosphomethylpyrimidine synthase
MEDVKEGVIVSKLAAHAADIAKGIKGAMNVDIRMAKARKALDWNGQIALSLNPEKVREWRAEVPPTEDEVCSMCGEFCAIRTVERALKKK